MTDPKVKAASIPRSQIFKIALHVLAWCTVIAGLYWSSLYSYTLFHSLIEIFSIIVSACIFLIAWNSRRFLGSSYLLFLGISFLSIAAIDILHALSYKGMGVFQANDANLPTQLWIAMRYMLAVSFLIAPVFIKRKVNVLAVLSVYAAATILLLLSIFYWRIFPACYVEGAGLTSFKIYSEYAISLIFTGSLVFLVIERKSFERFVLGLLIGSIILSIGAELAFTTYVSVYGFSNMLGHLLIFASFYLIYKALIETGLTRPYDLMFRDLNRSEELYRSLFDNMLNGLAYCRMLFDKGQAEDFIYLHVNKAFEAQTGLKDVVGKKVSEVIPGIREADPDLFKIYSRVALTGQPEHFEMFLASLQMWFAVSAYSPAREYFVAVFDVITDRKQAEETIRASEEKYRLLVENAQEAILIAVDGIIEFANQKCVEITGYTQEEIIGRHFTDFILPDDRLMVVEQYRQRLNGVEIPDLRAFRIVRKSGEIKWVQPSGAVFTWEGRPATLHFISDITDRKLLEEEHQRVAKLESIGMVAGGIAHDFNNLLTAIMGNIGLASMETEDGSEAHERLEEAQKASIQARELTRQLLTFSKGGAPIKKLASLKRLLGDTVGSALHGTGVQFEISIPADLWHVEIDRDQVGQVIRNLVVNAQQAMPEGGTIEIKAENIALSETQNLGRGLPVEAGDYVRIAVSDHGSGIPAEHLDKIFDPFFTTRKTGSGLGLATAFSIARQHGGHLSVESRPGAGSTFYFYLPASTETAIPKQAAKGQVKPAGKVRILVMDDEQVVREVADRMLKRIGYKDIALATDGAEAIEMYRAAVKSGRTFNVVILDLTVPGGMGGRETVTQLLKLDPGVKAIVSSGYTDEPVMSRYNEYGFSGMVAKPYTIEQLGKAVQDVIGR